MASLVETAPEDAGALWTELLQHIAAIAKAELRATVAGRVRRNRRSPSAPHPPRSPCTTPTGTGLLEPPATWRAPAGAAPLYPEVDADLALAGILTHDIGKVGEYQGDLGHGPAAARASCRAT